jgi:hypothetical protein
MYCYIYVTGVNFRCRFYATMGKAFVGRRRNSYITFQKVGQTFAVEPMRILMAPMGMRCSISRRSLCAAAFAVILACVSGCAAYRKCGFDGCPGDAEISAKVRALFEQHPELEPPNLLDVQTVDHVVYLYGVVDTDFEQWMAESVALQAPGVTKVVNSIGLSGGR